MVWSSTRAPKVTMPRAHERLRADVGRDRRSIGPVLGVAYGVLAALGALLAWTSGHAPWEVQASATDMPPAIAHLTSVGAGLLFAHGAVWASRQMVTKWGRARALYNDLRPVVRDLDDGALLAMAIASAVGEELFFRGFLTNVTGIFLSSLVFGLVHQVRGTARWVWAGWATLMGLMFATLYVVTGSLAGPVLAHFLVNWKNLHWMRDASIEPEAHRPLGGILSRSRE